MPEKQFAVSMKILKWLIDAAIVIFLVILGVLFFGNGSGLDLDLGWMRIKAHTPTKPLVILGLLLFLRMLSLLERKNALLLLISVVFSMGMAEAALRIVDIRMAREPELKEWRRPSATLGWELIPNLKGKGHLGSHIQINSHGLRDVEHTWEKGGGSYRILGLGDSFTFGYGVTLEEGYLKKLESLCIESGRPVEVINAGVIGYSFYQSLTYLKQKGLNYNPDLIILFYYIDDLTGINSAGEAERIGNELSQEREKPHSTLSASYLYNFVKNSSVLIDVKFRSYTGADWIKSLDDRKIFLRERMADYTIDAKKLRLLKELLGDLKVSSSQIGADLLIVGIPDAAQIGDPEMQLPYRILQGECSNLQIPFLDITSVFEAQTEVRPLYLFPMDAHTSAQGNSMIADALYKFLGDKI